MRPATHATPKLASGHELHRAGGFFQSTGLIDSLHVDLQTSLSAFRYQAGSGAQGDLFSRAAFCVKNETTSATNPRSAGTKPPSPALPADKPGQGAVKTLGPIGVSALAVTQPSEEAMRAAPGGPASDRAEPGESPTGASRRAAGSPQAVAAERARSARNVRVRAGVLGAREIPSPGWSCCITPQSVRRHGNSPDVPAPRPTG